MCFAFFWVLKLVQMNFSRLKASELDNKPVIQLVEVNSLLMLQCYVCGA
jgi:hypothetical protein